MAMPPVPSKQLPIVIQGGMGVAVSSWKLANEVSRRGQLGVVSGTALDAVLARKLQDGDAGGHVRRAMDHFPVPGIAQRVLETYYLPNGRKPHQPYRPLPDLTVDPSPEFIELSLVGNFVEVWLAKQGHAGVVGINLLEKIQSAILSATLGAMLADVDYVLMGAGIPKQMPQLLRDFAAGRPGHYLIEVEGATSEYQAVLDPRQHLGDVADRLNRPDFIAIIAQHILASYLARDDRIRPEGFVVEGPHAGGHSAPPRGKLALDDDGDPIYGPKDDANLAAMVGVGLPFWLAGGYTTPEMVAKALDAGAQGVQVGTLFALSKESGLAPELRAQLLQELAAGTLHVRNDPRASPTGFPFKIANLAGTLSEEAEYQARNRICDLGYLRRPYQRPDGTIGYRCASEPVNMYLKKGGDIDETVGRKCLCNSLMANVGFGQLRKDGYIEQAAVTLGQDVSGALELLELYPQGYTGGQAVEWLLSGVEG